MVLDTGATAWVLISAALVLLMVPAVGLFYGGMVRRKNVISTMMLSFVSLALGIVQWIIIGYTLAFGGDVAGLIGSLEFFGLSGIPFEATGRSLSRNYPGTSVGFQNRIGAGGFEIRHSYQDSPQRGGSKSVRVGSDI